MYFLMATFFNLIVMLNLLIAIISDTYTRIQEQKVQLAFQTKASIISDYLYLDVGKVEENQRNPHDMMLIVAMESEKRDNDNLETTNLSDVMKELKQLREKMTADIGEVKAQVRSIQDLDEEDSDKEKN